MMTREEELIELLVRAGNLAVSVERFLKSDMYGAGSRIGEMCRALDAYNGAIIRDIQERENDEG